MDTCTEFIDIRSSKYVCTYVVVQLMYYVLYICTYVHTYVHTYLHNTYVRLLMFYGTDICACVQYVSIYVFMFVHTLFLSETSQEGEPIIDPNDPKAIIAKARSVEGVVALSVEIFVIPSVRLFMSVSWLYCKHACA